MIDPCGPIQNTSSCSGTRDTATTGDPSCATSGGVISNGECSAQPPGGPVTVPVLALDGAVLADPEQVDVLGQAAHCRQPAACLRRIGPE